MPSDQNKVKHQNYFEVFFCCESVFVKIILMGKNYFEGNPSK